MCEKGKRESSDWEMVEESRQEICNHLQAVLCYSLFLR